MHTLVDRRFGNARRAIGVLAILASNPAVAGTTLTVGDTHFTSLPAQDDPTNVFYVTQPVCIQSFANYAITSRAGQTLDAYWSIYSSSGSSGTYSRVRYVTTRITIAPAGAVWWTSPRIDTLLSPGSYYGLSFGLSAGNTTSYHSDYGPPPVPVPFGTAFGSEEDPFPDTKPPATTFALSPLDRLEYQQVTWTTNPDEDGDGQSSTCFAGPDCNDASPSVYFGAPESCDMIDSNCNSSIVDTFPNFDGDTQPDCVDLDDDNDFDDDVTDCNDNNKLISRFASEVCDGVDNDCDGQTDENYPNADGDALADCVDPDDDNDGSNDTLDCKPFDATIHPGATEVCDLIDTNCDGSLIDGFTNTDSDAQPDCVDLDDDNDGDPDTSDCNDVDKTVFHGAAELCDAIDSDCDSSLVDNYPNTDSDLEPDCLDLDDDNDGDPDIADCAPLDASRFHGAAEVCDLIDQDCDSDVLEAFPNNDADTMPDCVDPDDDDDGSLDTLDCKPFDAGIKPGASEVCDTIDQDCDNQIDEGLAVVAYYVDGDGDGYGAGSAISSCAPVAGRISQAGDCNDTVASVHPGMPEHCDGVDENCDGTVDEDPVDGVSAFVDEDLDGYGDPATPVRVCDLGPGAVDDNTDCDDADPDVYPGAPDVADGLDNDCDSVIDEDDDDGDGLSNNEELILGTDPESADSDGDGVPDGVEAPEGVAVDTDGDGVIDALDADDDGDGFDEASGDCDDADPAISPDATEVCDEIDNDCDGDTDGDTCPTTCGCGTGVPSGAWLAVVGVVFARRRRVQPG